MPGSFFNSSMSRVIGSANLLISALAECRDDIAWVLPGPRFGGEGRPHSPHPEPAVPEFFATQNGSDQRIRRKKGLQPRNSQPAQHAAHGGLHGFVHLP